MEMELNELIAKTFTHSTHYTSVKYINLQRLHYQIYLQRFFFGRVDHKQLCLRMPPHSKTYLISSEIWMLLVAMREEDLRMKWAGGSVLGFMKRA